MSKTRIHIDERKVRELRFEINLTQEEMADISLNRNCYISIATIKRIESGHPISQKTLRKLCQFFNVDKSAVIKKDEFYKNQLLSPWKKTTINWGMITNLDNSAEHKKISSICNELHSLLNENTEDEQVKVIFQNA